MTVFSFATFIEDWFGGPFTDYLGEVFANALVPESLWQEWLGGEWIDTYRSVHETYHASGQPTRILMQEWDGGEWYSAEAVSIEYDFAGRPTSYAEEASSFGEWSTNLREDYEYDSMGELAVMTEQYDFNEGEGLNYSSRWTFTWAHVATATDHDGLPGDFRLEAAYPNPFNPATTIAYRLGATAHVVLHLYDALGWQVVTLFNGVQSAGRHEIALDAHSLSSGQYMVRMESPGFSETRLVTLLK